MEEQKENILLEDLKFPKDFKFEFTSNGFKVNSTGGEFFPNKSTDIVIVLVIIYVICFIFGFPYLEQLWHDYNSPYNTNYFPPEIDLLIICVVPALIFCWPAFVIPILFKMCNVKTEYNFSRSGINISSKKGSLFIPRENISKIYYEKEKEQKSKDYYIRKDNYYIRYYILLDFKKKVYIPDTKLTIDKVCLFGDSIFKDKKTALFLFREVKKILI